MRRRGAIGAGLSVMAATAAPAVVRGQSLPPLPARLLAVGVTGAGALSPVGAFLPGGPIRDRPNFAAYTQPGRILDAQRVLVCSESQFGAPRAILDWPDGSVLSLDSGAGDPLVVPAGFASSDGQAAALDGRCSSSPPRARPSSTGATIRRRSRRSCPRSATPWGSRSTTPSAGCGSPTPRWARRGPGRNRSATRTGCPWRGRRARSPAGSSPGARRTARRSRWPRGAWTPPGVANAFLGPSPDGGGRAVFAVATATGAIVQLHSEKGVDGLAPDGTIGALEEIAPGLAATNRPVATRTGMLFNWVPDAIIYVADPAAPRRRGPDPGGRRHRLPRGRACAGSAIPCSPSPSTSPRRCRRWSARSSPATPPWPGAPTCTSPTGATGRWCACPRTGGCSPCARCEVPGLGRLGAGRLNGIAVSPDAQRLWLTVSGAVPGYPGLDGAVVEAPAFGPG